MGVMKTSVMPNLILTGWSKSAYLAAAAAALESLNGKAHVAGVSMESLAGVLSERGCEYETVYVLGIGLRKNIGAIVAALAKLKKAGVRTVWISSLPVAPEFAAEVCVHGEDPARRGFDELIDTPSPTLVDAVAGYFKLSDADARFYRAYAEPVQDRGSVVGKYQTLVLAAGWMHRAHADDSVYCEAIRALAARQDPKLWTKKIRDAFEEYVRYGRRTLLGTSPALAEVRRRIEQAARYERARVLILGPSGTGKETVAQQIHFKGSRKGGHFVAFNCASVTPNLLEDRFFGHEKGAFTGADKQTKGLFELADHGTLFLDEIGEMPLEAQTILLRALEEGKIVRVGGTEEIDVDVRLVVATNRNLPRLVREGRFRADLYQRISTLVIEVPPLAARKEDIREIADGWWLDMCWVHLSDEQLDALCDYAYPGNVRELLNILDRAHALEETNFVKLISEHKRINSDLFDSVSNLAAGSVPSAPTGSVPNAPTGSVPNAPTGSVHNAPSGAVPNDPAPVGADHRAARPSPAPVGADLREQPSAARQPKAARPSSAPVGADHRAARISPSVGTDPAPQAYPDNLNAATRQHVKSVFDKYNHNLTATKTALGISVNTLKKYLA